MSPLMIKMLINYYTLGDGHDLNGSPAEDEAFKYFKSAGFITHAGDGIYTGTDKCEVYVNALCATPEPVQKWIIPGIITDL